MLVANAPQCSFGASPVMGRLECVLSLEFAYSVADVANKYRVVTYKVDTSLRLVGNRTPERHQESKTLLTYIYILIRSKTKGTKEPRTTEEEMEGPNTS